MKDLKTPSFHIISHSTHLIQHYNIYNWNRVVKWHKDHVGKTKKNTK